LSVLLEKVGFLFVERRRSSDERSKRWAGTSCSLQRQNVQVIWRRGVGEWPDLFKGKLFDLKLSSDWTQLLCIIRNSVDFLAIDAFIPLKICVDLIQRQSREESFMFRCQHIFSCDY
jgi:hypothetical protein